LAPTQLQGGPSPRARAGYTCDGRGIHLGRYAQARRFGHISAAQMAAVIEAAEVITNDRIVPGGAR
jgi:hypothetical protein